jgi:hypothetical protein
VRERKASEGDVPAIVALKRYFTSSRIGPHPLIAWMAGPSPTPHNRRLAAPPTDTTDQPHTHQIGIAMALRNQCGQIDPGISLALSAERRQCIAVLIQFANRVDPDGAVHSRTVAMRVAGRPCSIGGLLELYELALAPAPPSRLVVRVFEY